MMTHLGGEETPAPCMFQKDSQRMQLRHYDLSQYDILITKDNFPFLDLVVGVSPMLMINLNGLNGSDCGTSLPPSLPPRLLSLLISNPSPFKFAFCPTVRFMTVLTKQLLINASNLGILLIKYS